MNDYIAVHKEEFGVEPICRVLSEHGLNIAPSRPMAQLHAQEASGCVS